MNIKDALSPTGKAHLPDVEFPRFLYITEYEGEYTWLNVDGQYEPLYYGYGIRNDWEPYYEIKRIQLENAEEVWLNIKTERVMITGKKDDGEIQCYFSDGLSCPLEKEHYVFHGEGTWNRIHPVVED